MANKHSSLHWVGTKAGTTVLVTYTVTVRGKARQERKGPARPGQSPFLVSVSADTIFLNFARSCESRWVSKRAMAIDADASRVNSARLAKGTAVWMSSPFPSADAGRGAGSTRVSPRHANAQRCDAMRTPSCRVGKEAMQSNGRTCLMRCRRYPSNGYNPNNYTIAIKTMLDV